MRLSVRWRGRGLLCLGLASASCSRPLPSGSGYNLVLVTLDTVRADHLGCYGDAAAETPNLDALAAQGVRFAETQSTAPLTLPSHATILSGLLPPHHGLHLNGAGSLPASKETLATALRRHGYRTAAFVGSFVLDHRFGLDRGFEVYDDDIPRDPLGDTHREAERPGAVVMDRAVAWLQSMERTAPVFMWVHLYDAHAPYEPPEPYRSRHVASPYDGEVASVDAQVGRLLQALDDSGRSEHTVVAVVGDHGESLGDHGELTHGFFVYQATLRVPFLLRAPGSVRAGQTLRTAVSLADVAPTLAGLVGVSLAAPSAGDTTDGRNLASALEAGHEPQPADLYAESDYPRTFGWSSLKALRRGSRKYIAAPSAELYDLDADPQEAKNTLRGAGRGAEFEAALARLGHDAETAPAVNDAEARERLASLGYLSPGPEGQARLAPSADPKERLEAYRAYYAASLALHAGRTDEASSKLTPFVAADPENPVFLSLLAEISRKQRDPARAIALYGQAQAAAPNDLDTRYNLAVTLQEAGRGAEAIEALKDVVSRDPGRAEAYNALGVALAAGDRSEEALAQFARASELDRWDPRPPNNQGNVLKQLGRFDEAAAAYNRALALAPRYAEAINGLGVLLVERDRPAEALTYFEQALGYDARFHEARLNQGIALELLGRTEEAKSAYQALIAAVDGEPAWERQTEAATKLLAGLRTGERRISK